MFLKFLVLPALTVFEGLQPDFCVISGFAGCRMCVSRATWVGKTWMVCN